MSHLSKKFEIPENELRIIKHKLNGIELSHDNKSYDFFLKQLHEVKEKTQNLIKFMNITQNTTEGIVINIRDFEHQIFEILSDIDNNLLIGDFNNSSSYWLWDLINKLTFIKVSDEEIAIEKEWRHKLSGLIDNKVNHAEDVFPL